MNEILFENHKVIIVKMQSLVQNKAFSINVHGSSDNFHSYLNLGDTMLGISAKTGEEVNHSKKTRENPN